MALVTSSYVPFFPDGNASAVSVQAGLYGGGASNAIVSATSIDSFHVSVTFMAPVVMFPLLLDPTRWTLMFGATQFPVVAVAQTDVSIVRLTTSALLGPGNYSLAVRAR